MNKFNINQENNAIAQHVFDDIILQQNNKSSAEDEAHGNIYSEIDEQDKYEIDHMTYD